MNLFKKKYRHDSQIERLDCSMSHLAFQNEAMKLQIEKLENKIPELVRAEIEQLLRNKSLSVVTLWHEEEFLTEVVQSRVKELKHKKAELEEAIIKCDKALTLEKGKK